MKLILYIRCDLQRVRRSCPNRTETGYCSPICPDCPLFDNEEGAAYKEQA